MDAIWYGIANFMEFIFKLIKPVGMAIDVIFALLIAIGSIFWLWYDVHERKTGNNFMSEGPEKK